MTQTSNLNQVLESIESLSVEDQEMLVELIRRRLIERRREEIAQHIAQAQADYEVGKVFRGSIEDVIAELRK
ncbi:MAG: hypothetical protein AAFW75_21480 [Cyanobacteria bacterium J06636_16]